MTIQEILKQSVKGDALLWVQGLECNIERGIGYPNVLLVNELISQLSEEQVEILKEKFKSVDDISQMHDKLVEIMVARKYMKYEPEFLAESDDLSPDIYLHKKEEYIEVKRKNYSKVYKKLEEKTSNYPHSSSVEIIFEEDAKEKLAKPLLSYTKDLIDKAKCQLSGKKGLVFLLYQIDFIMPYAIKSGDSIKSMSVFLNEFLIKGVQEYSEQIKVRIVCKPCFLLHDNIRFMKK